MIIKLIKTHPSVQFAHFYEHLICNNIKSYFYEHGLFKYTDYALAGTTFEHGGLVEIEIELYTEKARKLATTLHDLRLNFDDEALGIALQQLLAEEEKPVFIGSPAKIIQELKRIDSLPWQSIEDITTMDEKEIKRRTGLIHLTKGHQPKPRKITAFLSVEDEFASQHRHLLPLFRQFARFITYTAQDQISLKYGYYCGDAYFKNQEMYTELLVHRTNKRPINLQELAEKYLITVHHINEHDGFSRLLNWLKNTSYTNSPSTAPETYHAYNETGVYIGAKGWQTLATKENVVLLRKHTFISVCYGRRTFTQKL